MTITIVREIQKIINLSGGKLGDYIQLKHTEYLDDGGIEVMESIKNILGPVCRNKRECFFIKTQMAYDNFEENGLKEYFLYHALDYLTWWRVSRTWFGERIEPNPPSSLTRDRKRDLRNKTVYECLRKLENMLINLTYEKENHSLLYTFYHILTDDVFAIEESEEAVKYRFKDKTRELADSVVPYLDENFDKILDVIHQNEENPR